MGAAPSSRARAAAHRPAMPAPAMMSVPTGNAGRSLGARSARELDPRPESPAGTLGQCEFRLVLDVLDAHAHGAPDDDGPGVRAVHHALADANVLCLGNLLVLRVDEGLEALDRQPLPLLRPA